MRVGFPVVAAATGLAAVFVLAQAVQGVDGPDSPDVGPTIVLPAASPDEPADRPAEPVAPRVRTLPERDRTLEALPRPARKPKVALDDPAEPRPVTPQPRRRAPSPSTLPTPTFAAEPVEPDPTQIPVPVCPADSADDEASNDRMEREDRWDRRWNRGGDRDARPGWFDRRDRGCRD